MSLSTHRPLVWWHFSDVHWDARASTERRSFLSALFEDLRRRIDQHGTPDFIVISGDLSFSGEEAQLLDAEENFIKPLIKIAANENLPLFLVPGNHDLRRSIARTVNPSLILSIQSVKSLNEFLDTDELIDTVERPFASFEEFSHRHMPNAERGVLGWWQELVIRGTKLLIAGLNSAWASTYHKTGEGVVDDERYLLLGQRQLQNLIEYSDKSKLSLLILHHPLKWLNGFNEPHVKHLINKYSDFVLFGHTHTLHDLSLTLSATGTSVYLPSPAIYDRADTDTIEYARGYNIVVFDPISRKGNAYYFKYSAAYATKFSPFVELYTSDGQESFRIDLSLSEEESSASNVKDHISTYSEAISNYPHLKYLSTLIEKSIQLDSIERHALEYFEAVIVELVRNTEILEADNADLFWEAVMLSRALMAIDLQQLINAPVRVYRPRHSADALVKLLSDAKNDPAVNLKLNLDDYQNLVSLSLDTFSLSNPASHTSEVYRRIFSVPWLLSRLLLYCDYPELIPIALQSESRIAALFDITPPEQLAILGFKFDAARCLLSIDLRIRDRDGFLAVTMLKHYVDMAFRSIADFWRNSQRIFPPLSLGLEFPRWRNKQISDYYLGVETTPIVKLLMGRAMYRGTKHVWFREIVQNALDANSARRALDDNNYQSQLDITFSGGDICVIRDNGIGMSRQHILRYLTTLGRSIWSSDELHEGKPVTRETAIQAIGKFGIGFAAVFQDASRVLVRTCFFKDVGESGWLVDFTTVDKPFLLEAVDSDTGTEVEIKLKEGIPQKEFLRLVNEFFLYINENITIKPEAHLPRHLSQVRLLPSEIAQKALLSDSLAEEQIGPHRFILRCLFFYDFKGREKGEKPPDNLLIVANSGVRVFEQDSLILKPGKHYIWVADVEEKKPVYQDPNDSGLQHSQVIIDFEKGNSPILPSRFEIEIEPSFSEELVQIIYERFCQGLRWAVNEITNKNLAPKLRRKAILTAMTLSTMQYTNYWRDRNQPPKGFSRIKVIDETAVDLYRDYCPVWIQTPNGEDVFEAVSAIASSSEGVFVVEGVAKSSLFKVYAKAAGLSRWVLVEDRREFFLFSKVISSDGWKGFSSEKDLYSEGRRIFAEIAETPLVDILRGDYALITDEIFDRAAFIVLPSNLPGSWKRGEAAGSVRRDAMKTCPARVLVNNSHPLISAMTRFLESPSASEPEKHLLKLLMDNLCDGVVEQDRITVARERWKTLQQELRKLLKGIPDIKYETLVVRR